MKLNIDNDEKDLKNNEMNDKKISKSELKQIVKSYKERTKK